VTIFWSRSVAHVELEFCSLKLSWVTVAPSQMFSFVTNMLSS